MVVVGFFDFFFHFLKVVLPNVSPVYVASIFREQHSVLWCTWLRSPVFMAVGYAFVFFCRWVISVSCCGCIVGDKEKRLSVTVVDGCH